MPDLPRQYVLGHDRWVHLPHADHSGHTYTHTFTLSATGRMQYLVMTDGCTFRTRIETHMLTGAVTLWQVRWRFGGLALGMQVGQGTSGQLRCHQSRRQWGWAE